MEAFGELVRTYFHCQEDELGNRMRGYACGADGCGGCSVSMAVKFGGSVWVAAD